MRAALNVKALEKGFHKMQGSCNLKKERSGNREMQVVYNIH